MSSTLHEKTAAELKTALAAGETSAVEIAEACVARTTTVDEKVHAFLHRDDEDFLAQATASDERRAKGETIGPLDGVPVGL